MVVEILVQIVWQDIIVLVIADVFKFHLMNAEENKIVKAGKTVRMENVSSTMMQM